MTAVNVAKTFLASAGQFAAPERGRVFDFLAKFMDNPAHPSLSLERITRGADSNMWSARISRDLRAIVHRLDSLNTLLYAGHHDEAYAWGARRRVERHSHTGTLQIVETAEEVEAALKASPAVAGAPGLFATFDDAYLLCLGVPEDWLSVLRHVATDDQLLEICPRLPEEVAERLLALAAGELVTPPVPVSPQQPLAESPDNLRRFWVVQEAAELREILERPIEDWIRFLHPSQRELVTGNFKGPVKVTGAAGTGKSVVALHRARHLAALGRRVLLTSFVTTLSKNNERNLGVLCNDQERSRIAVSTVYRLALQLARQVDSRLEAVEDSAVEKLVEQFQPYGGYQYDTGFLLAEWQGVIDPQGIATWDEYRDAARRGRGKPLTARQRKECWNVLGRVAETLTSAGTLPWSRVCRTAREGLAKGAITSPFDAVVVDEVQDLEPQELQLLAALTAEPGNLMLVGDSGQRIYPGGFSLRALGIDVRGRSRVLRINYRTTDQIRRFADRLLPAATDDLDEGTEARRSRSLLHGPHPTLHGFATAVEQDRFIVDEVRRLLAEGLLAREIGVFARTGAGRNTVRERLEQAHVATHQLGTDDDLAQSVGVHLGTIHRAKGLEFKVVFAIHCSQGTIPHTATLARFKDPGDHEAALARERQLLYVTITRARDQVYLTWVDKPSRFLEGLS